MSAYDELKRSAFSHVIDSIDVAACFPAQVFRGSWGSTFSFESDRLFASEFSAVAAELLNVERAKVCCLLNLGEADILAYESASMAFIDAGTEPDTYDALLRQGGPAKGWLFGMDRFGCSSDRGDWSIYCEKMNDIAAIAVREPGAVKKYVECLNQLRARPIEALLVSGTAAPVPFSQLTESWRAGLTGTYGGRGSQAAEGVTSVRLSRGCPR